MADSNPLNPLPPAEWHPSLKGILEDMRGNPINVHGLLAHHPELLQAWWNFRNYSVTGGALSERERELVILTVADGMENTYEWQSHIDRGIDAGVTREEIEWIRTARGDEWKPKDAALIQAVRALLEHHEIPGEHLERLEAHFTTQQIMDIIFIHGAYVVLGCLLNTFDTPVDDRVSARLSKLGFIDSGSAPRQHEGK